MIMKLCARCQKLIQAPNRYCDICKSKVEKQIEEYKQKSSSRYNQQRDKKYIQFYNSKAWRNLRKKYISKHYLCEECQKEAKLKNEYTICLAEEVHHKEAIQTDEGWLRRLDEGNIIALCHKHHNIAHERFNRRR
jgi:5-methylcytosine-specific restriction protein A